MYYGQLSVGYLVLEYKQGVEVAASRGFWSIGVARQWVPKRIIPPPGSLTVGNRAGKYLESNHTYTTVSFLVAHTNYPTDILK